MKRPSVLTMIRLLEPRVDRLESAQAAKMIQDLNDRTEAVRLRSYISNFEVRLQAIERQFKPVIFLPKKTFLKEVGRATLDKVKAEIGKQVHDEALQKELKQEAEWRASPQSEGLVPEKVRKKARNKPAKV